MGLSTSHRVCRHSAHESVEIDGRYSAVLATASDALLSRWANLRVCSSFLISFSAARISELSPELLGLMKFIVIPQHLPICGRLSEVEIRLSDCDDLRLNRLFLGICSQFAIEAVQNYFFFTRHFVPPRQCLRCAIMMMCLVLLQSCRHQAQNQSHRTVDIEFRRQCLYQLPPRRRSLGTFLFSYLPPVEFCTLRRSPQRHQYVWLEYYRCKPMFAWYG